MTSNKAPVLRQCKTLAASLEGVGFRSKISILSEKSPSNTFCTNGQQYVDGLEIDFKAAYQY